MDGKQQFLHYAFDKLPRIENLPGLASASRSAGVVGMLVAQDLHQVEDRYGEMAKSLWTNCPNRAAFR
ncbi:TraM recognition domain-containing protein [Halocatena pleomorpha]|uniref:TraM recognition domain-containing protein n=1 Tax=Halocatena pleomorpha TaxID=1785090 RepID=UPI0034A275F9